MWFIDKSGLNRVFMYTRLPPNWMGCSGQVISFFYLLSRLTPARMGGSHDSRHSIPDLAMATFEYDKEFQLNRSGGLNVYGDIKDSFLNDRRDYLI
jgi:hypothetical protein